MSAAGKGSAGRSAQCVRCPGGFVYNALLPEPGAGCSRPRSTRRSSSPPRPTFANAHRTPVYPRAPQEWAVDSDKGQFWTTGAEAQARVHAIPKKTS